MPIEKFQKMLDAKEIIEARKLLMLIDAVSFPNAQKETRKKFHKELFKRAFPDRFRKENSLPLDEAFKKLLGSL